MLYIILKKLKYLNKLIIIQTAVPHYRKGIFTYLNDKLGDRFILLSGNYYFDKSIKRDESLEFIHKVQNIFLLNRRLLLQYFNYREVLSKNNTVVLEMNPRILTNWMILLIRFLLRRNTVLWGHAWPRKGKESKSDFVRHFMRAMSKGIIVYTNTQASELRIKMPKKKIYSAPNALYFKNEMQYNLVDKEDVMNVIYVGRLSKPKKAFFLVRSFHRVLDRFPLNTKLIIVGEGEEKKSILNYISKHNIEDKVILKGHISDVLKLRELYSQSLLSVSPGYVGLSITQSLGFGVPMLISKTENHSPEIEAAIIGFNSDFFVTDNETNLGDKMLKFFDNKDKWLLSKNDIKNHCKKNYSIEAMAKPFLNLLKYEG